MRGHQRHCLSEASFRTSKTSGALDYSVAQTGVIVFQVTMVIIMSSCTHEAGNGYSFVV